MESFWRRWRKRRWWTSHLLRVLWSCRNWAWQNGGFWSSKKQDCQFLYEFQKRNLKLREPRSEQTDRRGVEPLTDLQCAKWDSHVLHRTGARLWKDDVMSRGWFWSEHVHAWEPWGGISRVLFGTVVIRSWSFVWRWLVLWEQTEYLGLLWWP